MAICTKSEQINTINVQLLIFRAKNRAGWMDGWMDGWVGGWVDGWMDGSKSRVKDCLQQSKIDFNNNDAKIRCSHSTCIINNVFCQNIMLNSELSKLF